MVKFTPRTLVTQALQLETAVREGTAIASKELAKLVPATGGRLAGFPRSHDCLGVCTFTGEV